MKKTVLLMTVAFSLPQLANAAMITFSQDGFDEGAMVTGSFTAVDVNHDGYIMTDEVSAFEISFSGNSLVNGFTLGFSDTNSIMPGFGLIYQYGSTTIGVDVNTILFASDFDVLSLPIDQNGNVYIIDNFSRTSVVANLTQGSSTGADGVMHESWSTNPVMINSITETAPVPVPAAAWLFSTGLIGLLTISRRRKNNVE